MSTHADLETRQAPPAETTDEPDSDGSDPDLNGDDTESADKPAPITPFDAHDAAARFGDSTQRLPNTVDGENRYRW